MTGSAMMVCATYRNPEKPSPLRTFGIMHLVEEAKSQSWQGDIKLAIVDSSSTPHPFFVSPAALMAEHGILYIHAPSRSETSVWRQQFGYASSLVPTDAALQTPVWQQRKDSLKAWEDFIYFTEDFRRSYKGLAPSAFMDLDRPCIGMKKNIGIAALTETYGQGDYIIFCDDDDRHHTDYVTRMVESLQNHDFSRLSSWLTLALGPTKDKNQWGMYDVPYIHDINNNWSVPYALREVPFRSTLKTPEGKEFIRLVGEKFNTGFCMTWPPLSTDGALHNYRYDTWQKSVETFGGCSPTSFCEDMLFYKSCDLHLPEFRVTRVDTDTPLFVRCSDGSNASLIEWNKVLDTGHPYSWAHDVAQDIHRNVNSKVSDEKIADAGRAFLNTGVIDWKTLFQEDQPKSVPSAKPQDYTP